LKAGDHIGKFQGKEVSSAEAVRHLAAKVTAGQTVRFTVVRGNKEHEISLKAGEGL